MKQPKITVTVGMEPVEEPTESHYISLQIDTTGAVESVTFSTRTVLGTYVTFTNLTDYTVKNKGTLKGVLLISHLGMSLIGHDIR